ncbi:hypothetical protein P7K49_014218 [Saguinus oedipus]|uniref:Uncharacterized protein n=1 Tax=Saguinus oedipus TaxID=9490 RepID=A0ABQ9VI56_SAGOE|nr:hypothetical protein P7K49_014218 [Saguinus oedipus]
MYEDSDEVMTSSTLSSTVQESVYTHEKQLLIVRTSIHKACMGFQKHSHAHARDSCVFGQAAEEELKDPSHPAVPMR